MAEAENVFARFPDYAGSLYSYIDVVVCWGGDPIDKVVLRTRNPFFRPGGGGEPIRLQSMLYDSMILCSRVLFSICLRTQRRWQLSQDLCIEFSGWAQH